MVIMVVIMAKMCLELDVVNGEGEDVNAIIVITVIIKLPTYAIGLVVLIMPAVKVFK